MIKPPIKKRFTSNTLTAIKEIKQTVKDDIIDYISMTIPSLSIDTTKEKRSDIINYLLDIGNYSKEELDEAIEAHKWWLKTLLTFGDDSEVKEFIAQPTFPFLLGKAIAKLESSLKLKLDNICATVNYLEIKEDYQLDNTLRLFNNEQAIAIGDYENYLIIASDKHCHVIDTKKFALDKIHDLFTNGKVNVFYKAEQTLPLIKNKKILMTNNIFDVTSAYKLLWGEQMTEEEINEKIDTQLGNLSDKDKAIKKTQYLLKVRSELRQEIIDKKLIKQAKELFESLADPFTINRDNFEITAKLAKIFEGEIVHIEKISPVLS